MKNAKERIIDHLAGQMSKLEESAFLEELERSPELKEELEAYRELFSAAQSIHREEHEVSSVFTASVMEKLEELPRLRRQFFPRLLNYSLASAAVATVFVGAITFLGGQGSVSFSKLGCLNCDKNGKPYISFGDGSYTGSGTSYETAKAKSDGVLEQLITRMEAPSPSKPAYRGDSYPPVDRSAPWPPLRPADGPIPTSPGLGETYGSYEENSRLSPRLEPLSTFSLDVDTGSYTNTRRFLQSGQLPPPESVRIEEFLNYFTYDYPTVDDGKPFSIHYEIAPSPLERDRYLLKLAVKAREPIRDDDRGWNLVFLVDVSGSMQDENKLPLVKAGMHELVDNMRPIDRMAIVTYAGDTGVALESTSGSDKSRIRMAIDRLRAGGSTYGSGGIQRAYEIAERERRHDGVNRIILATDGDFNVGVTDFSGLMELIEKKRRTGITLTTLGFGEGNYNERNLEQLANKGNGNYFYIDSQAEARRVLGEKLASNMEVVAKDAKVQVEFNPQQVSAYRLIGYDNRRLEHQDFDNDAVDAGDIGAGHTVTVLYEVVPAGSHLGKPLEQELRYRDESATEDADRGALKGEIAFVKIRFKKPNSDTSELLEFALSSKAVLSERETPSRDFRFAAAVSYFASILRQSKYAGSYTLSSVRELASGAAGSLKEREEFLELIRQAEKLGASR